MLFGILAGFWLECLHHYALSSDAHPLVRLKERLNPWVTNCDTVFKVSILVYFLIRNHIVIGLGECILDLFAHYLILVVGCNHLYVVDEGV